MTPRVISDDRARFASKTSPGLNGCIIWTGRPSHKGYGQFKAEGIMWQAHRWIYTQHVGPIPEGLQLDHLCHTRDTSCLGGSECPHRRCVNPAHLEPVTSRQNTMRSVTALAAVRAAATHCESGHPFSGANLYVDPNGYRRCRSCIRRWAAESKERRHERERSNT